jgi:hypothetical protein
VIANAAIKATTAAIRFTVAFFCALRSTKLKFKN